MTSNRLPILANEIRTEIEAVRSAATTATRRMRCERRLGQLMVEAKQENRA